MFTDSIRPGFRLGLYGQRHVDSHLVSVGVTLYAVHTEDGAVWLTYQYGLKPEYPICGIGARLAEPDVP